jgi:hypothetical protein
LHRRLLTIKKRDTRYNRVSEEIQRASVLV